MSSTLISRCSHTHSRAGSEELHSATPRLVTEDGDPRILCLEDHKKRELVYRYTILFTMGREWLSMSSDQANAESKVSGNQANIPARIRRELDIDDGDHLRWQIEDDGSVRVRVIQQEEGTFADFEGYDGETETNVTTDHDAWGIEPK